MLESTVFINEIVSWAFGEDGEYNPFRHKLGTYMAILHYCVEDVNFDNMGITELYDLIYSDNNANEMMDFMYSNKQICDLTEAADNTIASRFDIEKRISKLDTFIDRFEEYIEAHPEIMNGMIGVDNNGEKKEKSSDDDN